MIDHWLVLVYDLAAILVMAVAWVGFLWLALWIFERVARWREARKGPWQGYHDPEDRS